MADTNKRIVYTIELNDKGKVKIDGITKGFVESGRAVRDLKKELGNLTQKGLNPMIDKTGLAGATIVELGRTISDANYGIRGIANNLSQLSTLFITLISTTGGLKNGIIALRNAFMGPLGIIVVFQLAIALLERFSMNQQTATDEAENLTKAIDQQISVYSRLTDAITNYDLRGNALKDTVALLRSEFSEFDKAFRQLVENDLKITLFEKDAFGDEITRVVEGEDAIIALTKVFRDLKASEREEIILTNKLETATNEDIIKIKGKLKEEEREQIRLRKTLGELYPVVSKGITDGIEEEIEFTFKLTDSILKLKDARVAVIDEEMEKDNFLLQFKRLSYLEQINLAEENALNELDIYYQQLDNDLFYNQERDKIESYYEGLRQERMMTTVEALEFATRNMAKLFGEQSKIGKAFAIASATTNTYLGASQVLKDELIPTALKPVVMAGIIAAGLAQVKEIVKVDETGGGILKAGKAPSQALSFVAPDFNIVGATQTSQLAQTIAGAEQSPMRAYVVTDDINTAQELQRKAVSSASLG